MAHSVLLTYLLLLILPPHVLPVPDTPPPSQLYDATALLSFKSAADSTGGRLHFYSTANHYTWSGVSCSADGRVIRIVLECIGLNDTSPNSTLGRLDQLRIPA